MGGDERKKENFQSHWLCRNSYNLSDLVPLAKLGGKRLVSVGKSEKGLAEDVIINWGLIFVLVLFLFVLTIGYVCRDKAVATYMYFGEAMDFASSAANQDGDIHMVALNRVDSERFFKHVFAAMVSGTVNGNTIIPGDTAYYPGQIRIKSFDNVSPGETIPGGIARQPGYIAEIEVPLFKGDVPLIGERVITKSIKYFAVVKSSQNKN